MVTLNEHYVCIADLKKEKIQNVFNEWFTFFNNDYENGQLLLDMADWAQNNIDHRFTVVAGDIYFENELDFFKFSLTWSEYRGEENGDETEESPETWSAKP